MWKVELFAAAGLGNNGEIIPVEFVPLMSTLSEEVLFLSSMLVDNVDANADTECATDTSNAAVRKNFRLTSISLLLENDV
ncbi:hypothetical protein GL2_07530 [Microbulbifer sp. GL-2]|nr:hypothetical protein GL2_07530 [Microbulbifer sp. GL-2]